MGEFLQRLQADDAKTIETCLWGRDRIEQGNETGVPGVGRVFVGHTPQWGGLTRHGNVYAVGTGAVFGEAGIEERGRLTMARIDLGTSVLLGPASGGVIGRPARWRGGAARAVRHLPCWHRLLEAAGERARGKDFSARLDRIRKMSHAN